MWGHHNCDWSCAAASSLLRLEFGHTKRKYNPLYSIKCGAEIWEGEESIRNSNPITAQVFLLLFCITSKRFQDCMVTLWMDVRKMLLLRNNPSGHSCQNGLLSRLQKVIQYYVWNEQIGAERVNCIFQKVIQYLEKNYWVTSLWLLIAYSIKTSFPFLSRLLCASR